MAEVYYNHFTKSNDAYSAGILDFTPLKYPHPAEEVVQVMKEDGIDISQLIVKFLTKEMVDGADKIFIMCKKEECPDFLLNSNKITFWDIDDHQEFLDKAKKFGMKTILFKNPQKLKSDLRKFSLKI